MNADSLAAMGIPWSSQSIILLHQTPESPPMKSIGRSMPTGLIINRWFENLSSKPILLTPPGSEDQTKGNADHYEDQVSKYCVSYVQREDGYTDRTFSMAQ